MKKTALTKKMREDALDRMVHELCAPVINATRQNCSTAVRDYLLAQVPADVYRMFLLHPEYFHELSYCQLGDGSRANFNAVPCGPELRYASVYLYQNESTLSKLDPVKWESIKEAHARFMSAIEHRSDFRSQADRILSGVRYVEDLAEQWPDGMKYIEVPTKPAPLMVRADAIIPLVAEWKSSIAASELAQTKEV